MNFARFLGFLTLATVIFLFTFSEGGAGRTITVDDDGGSDYKHIQSAIDNAVDGDEIQVAAGYYPEKLSILSTEVNDLTILGEGAEITTVEVTGQYDTVLTITSSDISISGFSFRGGRNGIQVSDSDGGHHIFSNNFSGFSWGGLGINNEGGGPGHMKGSILHNNSFHGNNYGITLLAANDVDVTNNKFYDNSKKGITLENGCWNILLEWNSLHGTDNAIFLETKESRNIIMRSNIMTDGGIHFVGETSEESEVDSWTSHTIETSNTVHGKPVYYYKNASDIVVPDDAAQVIIANCDNILVKGIHFQPVPNPIAIGHSRNIVINNCVCPGSKGQGDGIAIKSSMYCTISNTSSSGYTAFGGDGIQMYHSNGIDVLNSNCSDNFDSGIVVDFTNSGIVVQGNNCSNNGESGIEIKTDDTIIQKNVCNNNNESGIFSDGERNILSLNTCDQNGEQGMICSKSNVRIENNSCNNNTLYGLLIRSKNSEIASNSFSWNGLAGIFNDGDHKVNIFNRLVQNDCSYNDQCGINITNCDEILLSENHLDSNGNYGIYIKHSSDITISKSSIEQSDIGFFSEWSEDIPFIWNTVRNCSVGYKTDMSPNELITDNFFAGNTEMGFWLRRYDTFQRNDIVDHPNIGIYLDHTHGRIENNLIARNSRGIVIHESSTAFIQNQIIENSIGVAADVRSVTFKFNVFQNNDVGIQLSDDTMQSFLYNNTFSGNTIYAVNATGFRGKSYDARWNWWGSNSGPYHPTKNPDGKGDRISNNLTFDPWTNNTAPNITVINYQQTAIVWGLVTISGVSWDEDGNDTIEIIEVSVGEGLWETADGTTYWNFTWSTYGLDENIYELHFRAYDGIAWSEEFSLLLVVKEPEPTPPQISIMGPKGGGTISGMVTIKGNVSDGDGIVQHIEISFNGGNWIMVNETTSGGTSWSYQWNTSEYPNGEVEVRTRIFDGTNYSNPEKITLVILNIEDLPHNDDPPEEENDDDSFIPASPPSLVIVAIGFGGLALRRKRHRRLIKKDPAK